MVSNPIMGKGGAVYIMSNYTNSVLYTGVTSNLISRVQEHKASKYPHSFTAKYKCFKLVYYESFHSIEEAITREKQIKGWKRFKKEDLINTTNPNRKDLYQDIKDW